jgi:hypothetical protein
MFDFFKKKREIKVEKVIKTYEKVNKKFSVTIPVIIRLSFCGSNNFLIKYDNNIFIDYIKKETEIQIQKQIQKPVKNKKICITSIKKIDSYSSLNCNCELGLTLIHENSQFDKNIKIVIPSKFNNNSNVVYKNEIIDVERLPGLDKLIPFLNSAQFDVPIGDLHNDNHDGNHDGGDKVLGKVTSIVESEVMNTSGVNVNASGVNIGISGGYYWKTNEYTIPYALFQLQEKRFPIIEKGPNQGFEIVNDRTSEILNELQSTKTLTTTTTTTTVGDRKSLGNKKNQSERKSKRKMIDFEMFNSPTEKTIYIDKRFFPLISSTLKSNMKFSYLLNDKRNCLKLFMDNNVKDELIQNKEETFISIKLEFIFYEVSMEDVDSYEFPIKLIF